jgi:hypothetical protein
MARQYMRWNRFEESTNADRSRGSASMSLFLRGQLTRLIDIAGTHISHRNLEGRVGIRLGRVAGAPELGPLGVDPSRSRPLAHTQARVLVGAEETPELEVIVTR